MLSNNGNNRSYLEISPQYHSASFSRLLVSVRAAGATLDFAGFAGRTDERSHQVKAARRRSSCSVGGQSIPGGVTSCSVVLSVSSFSTTISANSSSKDVLQGGGTFHTTAPVSLVWCF